MFRFNLFSCHKYLEHTGASILASLAKCDYDDAYRIQEIVSALKSYADRLKGHAQWEEGFVFVHLPEEESHSEKSAHESLDRKLNAIIEKLSNSSKEQRNIQEVYLDFRKLYSEILSHLHEEETVLHKKLFDKLGNEGLRLIDKPIYAAMSASEMVDMSRELLPPAILRKNFRFLKISILQMQNPSMELFLGFLIFSKKRSIRNC